jgi:hypothetical protein
MEPPPKKLLDQDRDAIKPKHYSSRTEESYANWIKRFIRSQLRFRHQNLAEALYTVNSGLTTKLTGRREFTTAAPDESSCKTRTRRSGPTICLASPNTRTARRDNPPSIPVPM